ncbi:MAG: hypothetical protein K0R68_2020 [Mycobacterium sp.]|nr:hypothetical protein [Mycobacterium sp.]
MWRAVNRRCVAEFLASGRGTGGAVRYAAGPRRRSGRVYEDPRVAATDMDNIREEHGYATRVDDTGRTWVFVIAEGSDSAPLAPLQRFGFELS